MRPKILRREHVDTGVDEFAALGSRRRLLLKTGNTAVRFGDDDTVLIYRLARNQANRCDGVHALVHRDEAIEREIGEVVASDDDEGFVAKKRFERLERAGAAHQRFFVQIFEAHAEGRPVAKRTR